uniref:Uncharacterized protein n=1 Tax=Timema tahoe TaxID=61484 RepID=A0A7R9IPC4_9NEOP|nr:unnamed protein product [Timema tahoe]
MRVRVRAFIGHVNLRCRIQSVNSSKGRPVTHGPLLPCGMPVARQLLDSLVRPDQEMTLAYKVVMWRHCLRLVTIAVIACLFTLTHAQSDSLKVLEKREFQLCGKHLADIVKLVCKGVYNTYFKKSSQDDAILMAEKESDLQNALNCLSVATDRMDLRITVSKTKELVFDKDGSGND